MQKYIVGQCVAESVDIALEGLRKIVYTSEQQFSMLLFATYMYNYVAIEGNAFAI